MKIEKNSVVCLDYTIRLGDGQVVESSLETESLTYIHGHRQIVPGVEQAVEGLEAGATLEVVVSPDDAYGDRDPGGIFIVPRAAFPENEEVGAGMLFSAHRPDGKSLTFRVVEANQELVLVDTNHPLAGETLHIALQVHSVRDASPQEIVTGRAEPETHFAPEYLA